MTKKLRQGGILLRGPDPCRQPLVYRSLKRDRPCRPSRMPCTHHQHVHMQAYMRMCAFLFSLLDASACCAARLCPSARPPVRPPARPPARPSAFMRERMCACDPLHVRDGAGGMVRYGTAQRGMGWHDMCLCVHMCAYVCAHASAHARVSARLDIHTRPLVHAPTLHCFNAGLDRVTMIRTLGVMA